MPATPAGGAGATEGTGGTTDGASAEADGADGEADGANGEADDANGEVDGADGEVDAGDSTRERGTVSFSDLAHGAYCLRQLYYARRADDRSVPEATADRMGLAFRYPALRAASERELSNEPIAVQPATYHDRLARLADRDDWSGLVDPADERRFVAGKDAHGVVHKLLAGDPPVPVIVSAGDPPAEGVWEPQTVRAVAAAKAVAWEEKQEIPRALVEYPAHGRIRSVPLTVRRKAAYRRTLRAVQGIDGVPSRLRDSEKCEECPFREECGVETRSLRSLLGL